MAATANFIQELHCISTGTFISLRTVVVRLLNERDLKLTILRKEEWKGVYEGYDKGHDCLTRASTAPGNRRSFVQSFAFISSGQRKQFRSHKRWAKRTWEIDRAGGYNKACAQKKSTEGNGSPFFLKKERCIFADGWPRRLVHLSAESDPLRRKEHSAR